MQSFWQLNLQIADCMFRNEWWYCSLTSTFQFEKKKREFINFWFFFSEPVLSSNELDEIQYNISTPGSFAFAERPTGSVSIKQRKQLFCRLKHIKENLSLLPTFVRFHCYTSINISFKVQAAFELCLVSGYLCYWQLVSKHCQCCQH